MKFLSLTTHRLFVPWCVQLILAVEWLTASGEKIPTGPFIQSMRSIVERFSAGNPHQWYVASVLSFAKQHTEAFGLLVAWGELAVGIGLVAAVALSAGRATGLLKHFTNTVAISALSVSVIMNGAFYFAAGWTSPSTEGLNTVMSLAGLALLLWWIGNTFTPSKENEA